MTRLVVQAGEGREATMGSRKAARRRRYILRSKTLFTLLEGWKEMFGHLCPWSQYSNEPKCCEMAQSII